MTRRFSFCGLVLVSILAGVLLLASCATTASTPATSPTASTPSVKPTTAATSTTPPKPTGSVTAEGYFGTGNMDPAKSTSNTFQGFGAAIFDSLVELSPEGQPRPGIAERWEISPDGMAHTFYIRKGVKFHNGDDLTAADVKFSIDRFMAPGASHASSAELRNAVASVELKDAYTAVLNMKKPAFELLPSFTNLSGAAGVLPKKYIEEKGVDYFVKNPVGSGPWKFVSYVPASRLELEAVESHWRAVPQFKNVTLLSVPEEATKVAMLKTGELDLASVSPDSTAGLTAAGVRIVKHDGASQYMQALWYDLEHPESYAFGDVRVRKALSLAINRRELADKVYGGNAEPSALFYGRPTGYFWDASVLKAEPYDPEQAKKLLAEAGYASGFKSKIWDTDPGGIGTTLNTAVVGYWRNIGVNMEIGPIAYSSFTPKFLPKPIPEIFGTVLGVSSAGGVWQFEKMTSGYHSKLGSFKNHSNLNLDSLIEKVPSTKDPAEKKKLALEAAVMAKNEYVILAVLDIKTLFATGSKIGSITPTVGMVSQGSSLERIARAK